jgi:molecular chaperone GrpE
MSDASSNGTRPAEEQAADAARAGAGEPPSAGPQPAPAQAAPGAEAAGEAQPSLAELLVRAQAEAAEFRDQYLRAKAESENIRRRGQEDVLKAHKFAIEGFAESLLPVRDSLEMALANATATPDSLKEGVDATLRLLASAFERNKLTEINPVGQKFDPNRHQAISMVPGNSVDPPAQPNHVVSVLQKGYLINDRVLRPAMVSVAQP